MTMFADFGSILVPFLTPKRDKKRSKKHHEKESQKESKKGHPETLLDMGTGSAIFYWSSQDMSEGPYLIGLVK